MKHLNVEEFAEYVDGLEFEEIEDLTAFVRAYYESYKEIEDDGQEKDIAWMKYVILTSRFGMTFVHLIENIIKAGKKYEDLMYGEEDAEQ